MDLHRLGIRASQRRLLACSAPDGTVVTYREFVENHLSPHKLAKAIVDSSRDFREGQERIGEIYLSPDAFARHTSEFTIADQLGAVLAENGLPRPFPRITIASAAGC